MHGHLLSSAYDWTRSYRHGKNVQNFGRKIKQRVAVASYLFSWWVSYLNFRFSLYLHRLTLFDPTSSKSSIRLLINVSGLRKRSSDKKDMLWEVDNDYVREIVQKYPLYKMKYHTVPFYDAGQMMLMISEEKYGLPKNCLISVTNKFWKRCWKT